jgi:uncharacterized membrane protein
VRDKVERRDPLWPEQLTMAVAVVLSLFLPEALTIGPTWLLPVVEALLFSVLLASTPRQWPERPARRYVRLGLVSTMSIGNTASLILLADYGVSGAKVDGRALLLGGIILWVTSTLLFTLWYWEMDRGGPVSRRDYGPDERPDFVFPQMQMKRWAPEHWRPELIDYLYLSIINAVTFGPPEGTVGITRIAKVVMGLQSVTALATDTLIVARAVNLLH